MTNAFLITAWIAVALLSIIESVNGMSKTLHWELVIDSPITMNAPDRSTTAWAPIYFIDWSLIQFVLIAVTHEALQRFRDRPRWMRLPSLIGMPEEWSSRFTRTCHIGLILLVFLLPLYAGGHFLWQTISGETTCAGGSQPIGGLAYFTWQPAVGPCYHDGKTAGVQFFPQWEVWLFSILYGAAVSTWSWFLWRLAIKNSTVTTAELM